MVALPPSRATYSKYRTHMGPSPVGPAELDLNSVCTMEEFSYSWDETAETRIEPSNP